MGDDETRPEQEQPPRTKPRVRRRRVDQTSDDTDRGWGEVPADEDAHDRWLQEQRPPHWD